MCECVSCWSQDIACFWINADDFLGFCWFSLLHLTHIRSMYGVGRSKNTRLRLARVCAYPRRFPKGALWRSERLEPIEHFMRLHGIDSRQSSTRYWEKDEQHCTEVQGTGEAQHPTAQNVTVNPAIREFRMPRYGRARDILSWWQAFSGHIDNARLCAV